MASPSGSWAQLRQQARSLESQTENLFHTYSAFTSDPLPKPSADEARTEAALQDILERREAVVSSLSRLLDSESAVNSSAAKLQNLTLHRSTLADHRREFSRLKSSIADSRNRTNLLHSVRNDISAFRSASQLEEGRSEADYMLDERARIDSSHNIADSVLSQAYAINADFGEQRLRLQQLNRRAMYAASHIPGINHIIAKINTRKKRDSVIMASLVAFCFLMLLYLR
ncbi:V-snare-domain-containing protein [Wilcoxina mikolae CBS 423.85]|nr:V-snare-domain-containing protein [Wilcoxina mikolae CBS 423.85]